MIWQADWLRPDECLRIVRGLCRRGLRRILILVAARTISRSATVRRVRDEELVLAICGVRVQRPLVSKVGDLARLVVCRIVTIVEARAPCWC